MFDTTSMVFQKLGKSLLYEISKKTDLKRLSSQLCVATWNFLFAKWHFWTKSLYLYLMSWWIDIFKVKVGNKMTSSKLFWYFDYMYLFNISWCIVDFNQIEDSWYWVLFIWINRYKKPNIYKFQNLESLKIQAYLETSHWISVQKN